MSDDSNYLLAQAELGFSEHFKNSASRQRDFQLMPGVVVREDESFESVLRQFKNSSQRQEFSGRPRSDARMTKAQRQKEKVIPLGPQEASEKAKKNATHEAMVNVPDYAIALDWVNHKRSAST